MENINLDVLIKLALELDDIDLLALCTTSKYFNEKICNRETIWKLKLKKYEPIDDEFKKLSLTPRKLYNLLKSLTVVKKYFNLKDTLLELYNRKALNLSFNEIKEIPKELGNLTNLVMLELNDNEIEEIPKELGNLSNLIFLYLNNNKIKEIPKELENLPKLKVFWLFGNEIKNIPKDSKMIKF